MWIVFGAIIAVVLALDLFVLHKDPHAVKIREALIWSGIWVTLSLAFGGALALLGDHGFGPDLALRFVAGYVIEWALSVDNLFVFAVIFAALKIPREYQHKLLFWGVFGALILRAVFIFAGITLIETFDWMLYIFGAILIFSALKMLFSNEEESAPEKGIVVRLASKLLPLRPLNVGPNFTVREDGKRYFTMLFIGLILVEVTDVIFALDSVPAVISVAMDPETREVDTFIVYTSNAFAILGLRSLYFALAGIMAAFRFLKYGLSIILIFVGVKMILTMGVPEFSVGGTTIHVPPFHMPIAVSLSVIGGVLALCVVLSLAIPRKVEKQEEKLLEGSADKAEPKPPEPEDAG
ncbi:MAG: TerC family protein [Planctomycetes bacterium]|nr:TerC family protein [Planctomycetota bacterium]